MMCTVRISSIDFSYYKIKYYMCISNLHCSWAEMSAVLLHHVWPFDGQSESLCERRRWKWIRKNSMEYGWKPGFWVERSCYSNNNQCWRKGKDAFVSSQLKRATSYRIILHLKYEERLLLRCVHRFKSDAINDMDQMHISGTETLSVILSQTM